MKIAAVFFLTASLLALSCLPAADRKRAAYDFDPSGSGSQRLPAAPPDLRAWLEAHLRVAAAIQWQSSPATMRDPFAPPPESSKTAWPAWTPSMRADLDRAYREACAWLSSGANAGNVDGLTDEPVNIHPAVQLDEAAAGSDLVLKNLIRPADVRRQAIGRKLSVMLDARKGYGHGRTSS
ncbi:MAG: hypothetical protein A2078_08135 [Nitrospirae bacterium GWC2_57_9]|nr:MAG: hypothetical protein A2078_08135 [Nitrospirae bacterium GWC2_57_9]